MSTANTQTAVATLPKEKEVAFIPFGGDVEIKLNVAIIARYCCVPTKTGVLPTESDCVKFMMLCRARKLNPFEGDCFLLGYDTQDGPKFSLITAQQAYLKRAEVNPEYDGMTSGVIVKDDKGAIVEREGDFTFPGDDLLGGWARVHFKARKIPTLRRLNLQTFDKGFGQWKVNKAGMIVKCAEADALRSSFPTMLGGLYSAEEHGNTIEVTSSVAAANLGDAPAPRVLSAPAEAPRAPKAAPKPAVVQESRPAAPIETPQPVREAAPIETAQPESVQSEEEAAAEAALGLAPEPPASTAPAEEENVPEAYKALVLLAEKSGVTLDQVFAFCKKKAIANKPEHTSLAKLPVPKLENLVKAWNGIVASVKEMK